LTANEFRRLALSLPDAIEAAHMGHPDFRVGGRIFATLAYPSTAFAALMLTPEQQELFVRTEPKTFRPVPGEWGRKGATQVQLRIAKKAAVREALRVAWGNRAPKK
jgi:hypothetical protein